MFELMVATLNMIDKALGKGVRMDFECTLCGHQFDGVLHVKPDKCPKCNAPERYIVDANEAARIRAENEAINNHDEYLEDR